MPTQRDRLAQLVGKLDADKTSGLARSIDKIVAEAQNTPPDGAADGSISEQTWEEARDFARELHQLSRRISRLQLSIGRQMAQDPNPHPDPEDPGPKEK